MMLILKGVAELVEKADYKFLIEQPFLLEEEDEGVVKELKQEGERIKLTLKPFEIVTLKVKL
jgi:alpha-mannosidase